MKIRIEQKEFETFARVVNAETGERIDWVGNVEIKIGPETDFRAVAVVTFFDPEIDLTAELGAISSDLIQWQVSRHKQREGK